MASCFCAKVVFLHIHRRSLFFGSRCCVNKGDKLLIVIVVNYRIATNTYLRVAGLVELQMELICVDVNTCKEGVLAFGVTLKVFTPCLGLLHEIYIHGACSTLRWFEM